MELYVREAYNQRHVGEAKMRRFAGFVFLNVLLSAAIPASAMASGIGILQQLSPVAKIYILGEGKDFLPFTNSAEVDVTAAIFAVDVTMPPDPVPGSSTSGCDTADFGNFVAGRIALIQRGACSFELKVSRAIMAGASGVLIFNEGQPGRTETTDEAFPSPSPLPVVFVSFAVGQELYNAFITGGATVRLNVTDSSPAQSTPEPVTLALVGIGLGVAALTVRRRTFSRRSRI